MSQNNGVVCSFKDMNSKLDKLQEQINNNVTPKGPHAGTIVISRLSFDTLAKELKLIGYSDIEISQTIESYKQNPYKPSESYGVPYNTEVTEIRTLIEDFLQLIYTYYPFYEFYEQNGIKIEYGEDALVIGLNYETFPTIVVNYPLNSSYRMYSFFPSETWYREVDNFTEVFIEAYDDYFCDIIKTFVEAHQTEIQYLNDNFEVTEENSGEGNDIVRREKHSLQEPQMTFLEYIESLNN